MEGAVPIIGPKSVPTNVKVTPPTVGIFFELAPTVVNVGLRYEDVITDR
jgi:hypothetical protein